MSGRRDQDRLLEQLDIDARGLLDAILLAGILPAPSLQSIDPITSPNYRPLTGEQSLVRDPIARLEEEGERPGPLDPEPEPSKPAKESTTFAEPDARGVKGGIIPDNPGKRDPSRTGTPFRIPSASALPNSLEIVRALRPLKKRLDNSRRARLDEDATANVSAQYGRGRIIPVLRSDSQRWLEAAVVFDASPEMAPWRATVDEFIKLLQRHGAFRDVRAWTLDKNARLHPGISPGIPDGSGKPASVLNDPRGRRLILVATLGRGSIWEPKAEPDATTHDRKSPPGESPMSEWLETLSLTNPLMLLMLLPTKQWNRTALGRPRRWVKSLRAGTQNPSLVKQEEQRVATKRGTRLSLASAVGHSVPILSLTPASIKAGARLLAGAEALVPAVSFERLRANALAVAVPSPDVQADETPGQKILAFRAWCSEEAYQLLHALAGVPIMLPAIHIVQRVAFRDATIAAVAEVLASGLIQTTDYEGEYAIPDDIRETLLRGTSPSRTRFVMDAVSHWISSQYGLNRGILAYAEDPEGTALLPESARRLAEAFVKIHRMVDPLKQVFLAGNRSEFGSLFRLIIETLAKTIDFVASGIESLTEEVIRATVNGQDDVLRKQIQESDIVFVLLGKMTVKRTIEEVAVALAAQKRVVALRLLLDDGPVDEAVLVLIKRLAEHEVPIFDLAEFEDFPTTLPALLRAAKPMPFPETVSFTKARVTSLEWTSSTEFVVAGTDGVGLWSRTRGLSWHETMAGQTLAATVLPSGAVIYSHGQNIGRLDRDATGVVHLTEIYARSSERVTDIAPNPFADQAFIYTGSNSLHVANIDVQIGQTSLYSLGTLLCCEFNQWWSNIALAGSAEGKLIVKSTTSNIGMVHAEQLNVHEGAINDLASCQKSDLIASASSDKTVGLFQAETYNTHCIYLGQGDAVVAIAFNADETLLASLTLSGRISLWDISVHPRLVQRHHIEPGSFYGSLAFHPTTNLLAAAAGDSQQVHLLRYQADATVENEKPYIVFSDAEDFEKAQTLGRQLASNLGGIWQVGKEVDLDRNLHGAVVHWTSLDAGEVCARLESKGMPVVVLFASLASPLSVLWEPNTTLIDEDDESLIDKVVAALSRTKTPDPHRPISRVFFTHREDHSLEWRQLEFLLTRRGFQSFTPGNDAPVLANDDLLIIFNDSELLNPVQSSSIPSETRIIVVDLRPETHSTDSRTSRVWAQSPKDFARVASQSLVSLERVPFTVGMLAQSMEIAAGLMPLPNSATDEFSEIVLADIQQIERAVFPENALRHQLSIVAYYSDASDSFCEHLFDFRIVVLFGALGQYCVENGHCRVSILSSNNRESYQPSSTEVLNIRHSNEFLPQSGFDSDPHILVVYSAAGAAYLIKRREPRPTNEVALQSLAVPRLRIAVVGTALLAASHLRPLAEAIGRALARYGYNLVAGRSVGVDTWVRDAFLVDLKDTHPSEVRYQDTRSTPSQNEYEAVAQADAAIFIGGRGWTRRAWQAARDAGKLVIPISSTRGDSAYAYENTPRPRLDEDVSAAPSIVDEAWSTLHDVDDPDAIVAAVMALLELAAPTPIGAGQTDADQPIEVPDYLRPYDTDDLGFLTQSGVTQLVADNLDLITDQGIKQILSNQKVNPQDPSTLKVLLLFKTPTQRTWIVATPTQLAFVLDDEGMRLRSNLIQEVVELQDVHLQFSRAKNGAPVISFKSNSSKGWLYSKSLFPSRNHLREALKPLLTSEFTSRQEFPSWIKDAQKEVNRLAEPTTYSDIPTWALWEFGTRLAIDSRAVRGLNSAVYANLPLVLKALRLLANEFHAARTGGKRENDRFISELRKLKLHYGPVSASRKKGLGSFHAKGLLDADFKLSRDDSSDPQLGLHIYFTFDEKANQTIVTWLPSHIDYA